MRDLVTIVIVSWNSADHLQSCLFALTTQSYTDFEVVIVDNGSSDDTLLDVEENFPTLNLCVKRLRKNTGFAAANNVGARLARGKWLALLNADAFPESDWLEQLVRAAQENPEFTFFSSRQIQVDSPDLLDGTGDAYHVSGLAWRENYNYPASSYGIQSSEVFSACAAAALYRREDFLKVGGFDEDYFSYHEDVDLGFRLRLIGGRCLYVSTAAVHHVGSASTGKESGFSFYHGHRNLVWTFFKDMPSVLFWAYLPLHMLINVYFSISFLLLGKGKMVLKSKVDAFSDLSVILRKRKQVQQTRTASSSEIYRVMTKGLLTPYKAARDPGKK